jgi:hypothetical protein
VLLRVRPQLRGHGESSFAFQVKAPEGALFVVFLHVPVVASFAAELGVAQVASAAEACMEIGLVDEQPSQRFGRVAAAADVAQLLDFVKVAPHVRVQPHLAAAHPAAKVARESPTQRVLRRVQLQRRGAREYASAVAKSAFDLTSSRRRVQIEMRTEQLCASEALAAQLALVTATFCQLLVGEALQLHPQSPTGVDASQLGLASKLHINYV